jgi:hypothetical protein
MIYFPPNRDDQLAYIRDLHGHPFTEMQMRAIETASKTAKVTQQWLRWGIWWTTIATFALVIIPALPPVADWTRRHNTNNLTLGIILALGWSAINAMNFLATGTFPDRSASTRTQCVHELDEAERMYEPWLSQLNPTEMKRLLKEMIKIVGPEKAAEILKQPIPLPGDLEMLEVV